MEEERELYYLRIFDGEKIIDEIAFAYISPPPALLRGIEKVAIEQARASGHPNARAVFNVSPKRVSSRQIRPSGRGGMVYRDPLTEKDIVIADL